jgi:hypothetical protein
MRQTLCSEEDRKFCQALEKDCSTEDIHFLHSRITSHLPGKKSICDEEFRNIAIITAKNIQKMK